MTFWSDIQKRGGSYVLHEFERVFQDVNVGRLLSQLVYWYSEGKDGLVRARVIHEEKTWVVRTAKEWQQDTGLSEWKLRAAVNKLRDLGLIELAMFPYQRALIRHIRLDLPRLVQLIAENDAREELLAEQAASTPPGGNLKGGMMESQPLYIKKELLETCTASPVPPEAAELGAHPLTYGQATPNPGLENPAKFQTPKMEELQEPENPSVEISHTEAKNSKIKQGSLASPDLSQGPVEKNDMSSAKEVLLTFSNKKIDTQAVSGINGLVMLWKKRMTDHTPEFVKELTGKQTGQLKHVLKALDPARASEAVEFVMANWTAFTWEVGTAKGISKRPTLPDPGFFCSHYEVALQLIAKKKSSSSTPGSPKSKETCTMPVTSSPTAVVKPLEGDAHVPETDLAKQQAVMDKLAAALKSKG